jgi:hypothetical protein
LVAKVKSTALVWTIWLEKKDFEAAAQHFGVLGGQLQFRAPSGSATRQAA